LLVLPPDDRAVVADPDSVLCRLLLVLPPDDDRAVVADPDSVLCRALLLPDSVTALSLSALCLLLLLPLLSCAAAWWWLPS